MTTFTLTAQQEDRYITFCDRNDLDVMLTVEEQLDYLDMIDAKPLFSALRGIVCPKPRKIKMVTNPNSLFGAIIDVVVDMTSATPVRTFTKIAHCANLDKLALSNTTINRKTQTVQWGLAF